MADDTPSSRSARARGRPPLPDDQRRRARGIYMSPEELAVAQSRARMAGLEFSAYVRQAITTAQVRAPGHIAAQQWRELSTLQSNVNQLAHRINVGGAFGDADRELLERLEVQVRAIRLALAGASS